MGLKLNVLTGQFDLTGASSGGGVGPAGPAGPPGQLLPVSVSGAQNGSNRVFTLGSSSTGTDEQVFYNGQLLNPGSGNDYTVSGTTLTFDVTVPAPISDDLIRVFLSQAATGGTGAASLDAAGSTVLAAVNIPAYAVVTVDGNLADSSNAAHFGRVEGIAIAAINTGFIGTVEIEGEIVNSGWSWSPNTKLFLNGTVLSASAPTTGFAQMVAVAKNAMTIIIRIGTPVLL